MTRRTIRRYAHGAVPTPLYARAIGFDTWGHPVRNRNEKGQYA